MKSLLTVSALIALLASPALAADPVTVRISTGGQGNAYWKACEKLKTDLASVGKVECLTSDGSTENLNRLTASEADLAFVQADALAVKKKEGGTAGLDQIASVGREYVQLVCNTKSGIGAVSDLEGAKPRPKVLVGGTGSGAAVTLRNWIIEDEDYKNIEPVYQPATGAGALALKQNKAQCAIIVSALGGATMSALDKDSGGALKLVDINDGDFNDSTDIDGNPVYEFTEIDSSTYSNLLGWSDVDTTVQDALLVGANRFTQDKANGPFMDALANMLFVNSDLVK